MAIDPETNTTAWGLNEVKSIDSRLCSLGCPDPGHVQPV